jgi:acyl carrier protein
MKSLREFVVRSIAEACHLDPAAIQQSTRLADIGFDSLSAVSLTGLIEAQYSLELSQSDITVLYEAARVSDVIDLVTSAVVRNAETATHNG